MSEEKKQIEVNCPRCSLSFDVELHSSVYSSIPWRKPSERPKDLKLCLVLSEDRKRLGTYDVTYDYFEYDGEGELKQARLYVDAWCYVDEIPLPDWVQK